MTDIQKIEGEIKVLQAKLELLKEIVNHKEQEIKEAYKVAYGSYPAPDFSAGDGDVISWDAFKKGYEAGQSKAVPPNEPYCPDEPLEYDEVEWDEKDNPKTLFKIILEWCDDDNNPTCEELLNRISEWLPPDDPDDGEEFQLGWNSCLNYLRDRLK